MPVAVIGAGTAGLGSALFTGRAKGFPYVFTDENIGGNLNAIKNIENWPAYPRVTGTYIAENLRRQVKKFGVRFIPEKVVSVDLSKWPYTIKTKNGSARALSIIIATGFSPKKPDIQGVDKYWGLGVSTCTLCDAPFHKGQNVIIAGGDDYAAERALQLAAYAKKVTMVIEDPHLTATAIVKGYLKSRSNITMLFNSKITRIVGDGKQVTGVEIYNHTTKTHENLSAKGVYVNSVYVPNSNFLNNQINIDSDGYIILQPGTQKTSIEGVFAAGTVTDRNYRKAIIAYGDGAKAGIDAIKFMKKHGFYGCDPEQIQSALFHVDTTVSKKIDIIETQKDLRDLAMKHRIIVIYFYRLLCPYCQETIESIRNLKAKFANKIHVVKANAHTAEQLTRNIDIVPYVIVYKDGVIEKRLRGVEIKNQLHGVVNQLVKSK